MTKKCLLFLVICILILAIPFVSIADFGDFSGGSDYGSGWDSSSSFGSDTWDTGTFSGGGSTYSGGSSGGGYYGGSFFGGPIIISGGNSYGTSTSSNSSGGDSMFYSIFMLIFIAVLVIFVIRFFKKAGSTGSTIQGAQLTPQSQLTEISQYTTLDPNFNQTTLETKLANIYIQMQECWQNKKLEPLRPYMTDAYYAQAQTQLQTLIDAGRTNIIERPTVLSATCRGYYQADGQDHIVALVRSRIIDYTIDDKTGELVAGYKNRERFMVYEWELVRNSGIVSDETADTTVHNCPNCGAPLNINATAECPYCGSIVTVDNHSFVITRIKGISQTTGGKI